MGDLDLSIDAFKHLPYFKPMYTTILRQQMQYLTEQLSKHAGEESLVLTANISAGTISSLTSVYGTGFLNGRADIKTQFTRHCARNKLKHEKGEKRKSIPDHAENLLQSNHGDVSVVKKHKSFKSTHEKKNTDPVPAKLLVQTENGLQTSLQTTIAIATESIKESSLGEKVNILQVSHSDKPQETPENNPEVSAAVSTDDNADKGEEISQQQTGQTVAGSLVLDCTGTETPSKKIISAPVDASCDDREALKKEYLKDTELLPMSQSDNTIETSEKDMWIVAGKNKRLGLTDIECENESSTSAEQSFRAVKIEPSCQNTSDESFPTGFRVFSSKTDIHLDSSRFSLNDPNSKDDVPYRFKCTYCTNTFTTFASQRRHERRHTGETPWSCEICDMKFYRKDDLNVHVVKHQGLKPFQCTQCFVGYSKKKFLEEHMIAVHSSVL